VQQGDVGKRGGVEDLGHRAEYGVVGLVDAGVYESRPLVLDQELVERDLGLGVEGRDPVDPVDDLVDPGRGHP